MPVGIAGICARRDKERGLVKEKPKITEVDLTPYSLMASA